MPILKKHAEGSAGGGAWGIAGSNAGGPMSEGNESEHLQVSDYELQREANIKRNQQLLAALGLQQAPTHAQPSPATPRTSKKRPRDSSALTASTQTRRSARAPAAPEGGSSAVQGGSERADPPATPAPSAVAAVSVASGAEPFGAGAAAGALRPLVVADSAKAAGSSSLFAQRILQVVQTIPRGKVASYGQCAAMAGSPNSARQVGKLLSLGLAGVWWGGTAAPWQRVVNASGGISLPPAAGGIRQPFPLVCLSLFHTLSIGAPPLVQAALWALSHLT